MKNINEPVDKLRYITNVISLRYTKILGKKQEPSIEKIIESIIHYYENIISCMPGNVYWLDKNGIGIGCNKNVLQMFGLQSLDEFKGLTFEEMGKIAGWLPEATKSFKHDSLEVIRTGKAKLNIEEPPIPDQNGEDIYFLTSRVPLFDESGSTIGIVGISVDITERKKMEASIHEEREKAISANYAKTEFLQNMRHDIRTPLTSIVGFAELLREEKEYNKIHQYTQQLADAGKELLRFLNEVLESINVSSGEIPLLKKKFDLKSILDNVIKLHRPMAEEKQLALEYIFDDNIPKLIGDPIRIYRILLELLVNALKFTQEGYIKITTKLAQKKGRDVIIQIEIEDTGPGIPEGKQQELFLRFKRLTPSFEGIYKGSGLGLSIAKQFIDDLEGEIYYDKKHKGAKFVCLIPVKQALLENTLWEDTDVILNSQFLERQSSKKSSRLDNISKEKTHILIVEDQPMAASVLEEVFTKLSCSVEIAVNGEEAIKLAKNNGYNLILMDIGLPDINGCEVTRQIRLNESIQRIPIIGLTAHVDAKKKQEGLNAGMNLVLSKPLLQETAIGLLRDFVPSYQVNAILT